jgi:hypothetical protein
MARKCLSACVLLVGVALGCNSARHVVKEPTGGVIAIPNNTNAWPTYHREHAEELMADHLPAGYVVTREEEVVTGVVSETQSSVSTQEFGPDVKVHGGDQVTTTRNATEWHIHYQAR